MADIIPTEMRGLRACLLCSLVKTYDQFFNDGCDNCEEVLKMAESRSKVFDCTTQHFTGVVALMSPSQSWVAKWQRIRKCREGIYALSVTGSLPQDIIDSLQEKGIEYRPRDGSK